MPKLYVTTQTELIQMSSIEHITVSFDFIDLDWEQDRLQVSIAKSKRNYGISTVYYHTQMYPYDLLQSIVQYTEIFFERDAIVHSKTPNLTAKFRAECDLTF